jgi:hypothetical protein
MCIIFIRHLKLLLFLLFVFSGSFSYTGPRSSCSFCLLFHSRGKEEGRGKKGANNTKKKTEGSSLICRLKIFRDGDAFLVFFLRLSFSPTCFYFVDRFFLWVPVGKTMVVLNVIGDFLQVLLSESNKKSI